MPDLERDVRKFHRKFRIPTRWDLGPGLPSEETKALRVRLVREEVEELIEAIEEGDVVKIAHEAVDVLYVVVGLLVTYGVSIGPVWRLVHRANMRKEPDPDGGKIRKPEGWEPADVRSEIRRQVVRSVRARRRRFLWW